MPAPKGNKNALKHGLYARYFTEDNRTDLAKMPVDEFLMELAALRLSAARAFTSYDSSTDMELKLKSIQICVDSLQAIANLISKQKLLSNDSPVLQDLWDAVKIANKAQGWDNEI